MRKNPWYFDPGDRIPIFRFFQNETYHVSEKMNSLNQERRRLSRDRGIPQRAARNPRGYAAKALDKRLSDYPLVWKRGLPLFLPPARTGLG